MSKLKGIGPELIVLIIIAAFGFGFAYLITHIDWISFVIGINNYLKLSFDLEDRGTKTLAFLLTREGGRTAAEEIGGLRAGREPAGFVEKAAEALRIKVEIGDDKGRVIKKYGVVSDAVDTTIALPGLKKGRVSVG
ncbi:MAG: hypothetical protein HYX24_01490 [Candidatus Aenigmarchaeota archaeon]|nr:hypothetical protein [Candidatus Aenigmarchaeota archaeon]